MKLKLLSVAVLIFTLGLNTAQAQTRQGVQKQRIAHGVRSGEITKAERMHVARLQAETRRDVRAARYDGRVSVCERREIRNDRNRTSRAIYRTKHNNRNRF